MKLITTNKVWPIRVANHKVNFTKAFPLNELDEIILSIMSVLNDSVQFSELGALLGFAVENKPEEHVLYDPAEENIFQSILDNLLKYHLLEIIENEEKICIVNTTTWGKKARETNFKYWFYEGLISVNEHQLFHFEETFDNTFPFYKLGVFSEISNSKIVAPSEFNSFDQEKNLLLKKALLNFSSHSSIDEGIEIQWVEEVGTKKSADKINCYSKIETTLGLTLLSEQDDFTIETAFQNNTIPEFNEIIQNESNSILFQEYILELRYELYKRDAELLIAKELSDFSTCITWDDILTDNRIVWDENLLEMLASEDLSTNSIWNTIIINCPENILINNISKYTSFWDWSKLTNKLDIEFITAKINEYPWDFDYLIERVDTQELENLVLAISEPDLITDWLEITRKVTFSFIENQIGKQPFDLIHLTRLDDLRIQRLVMSNPKIDWDWSYISNSWPIDFILIKFEIILNHLNFEILFKRLLSNYDEFELAFKNNLYKEFFNENIDNISDKIGISQNVVLNSNTLKVLSENNLLFWGINGIPGVESNKNFKWTNDLFGKYSDKVKTQPGFDYVSKSVESIEIIEINPDFPWNFDVLSDREDLNWNFDFIQLNKSKLDESSLIYCIPNDLVSANLSFFIPWFNDSENQKKITDYINQCFSLDEILKNKELLTLNKIDITWSPILKDQPSENLIDLMVLFEGKLFELPSPDDLIKELSSSCNIEFILQNFNLSWDWKIITVNRLNEQMLTNNEFLLKYAEYLYWPYIIDKYCSVNQLIDIEKLTLLANNVIRSPTKFTIKTWSLITAKIPPLNLYQLISKTFDNEMFKWDWDYISSSRHIPIEHVFLSTYKTKINWSLLSRNLSLSSFFQNNKTVYANINAWLDRTFQYLEAYLNEWDFDSLSTINNLTWHDKIVREFKEKWNWEILSKQSNLLTKQIKEKQITEYDERRLKDFAEFIDWEILSERYEVTLTASLVEKFINEEWDWKLLSSHPKFKISRDFLNSYSNKEWDFKALSSNEYLSIDKDFIMQFPSKNWDYSYFSSQKWVDNEVLISLPDVLWNWSNLSSKKDLIFDLNLLKLFVGKEECNWSSILSSDNLHITADTLQLLFSNNILDKKGWTLLSSNKNLDFVQHEKILENFKQYWDWTTIIEKNKIDINDVHILKKYKNLFDWNLISLNKRFMPSIELLSEFKELLNWKDISKDLEIDFNSLHLFKDYLDWELISKNTSIAFSIELITEFKEYWNFYYLKNNIALSLHTKQSVDNIINSIPELELYFKLMEQNDNWAGYIYHFTHISNAVEIIKNSKILSRNKATYFADAAGSVVGRRDTAHEFARFYFRPQTPTQFYNEALGKDINSGYWGWTRGPSGSWTEVWKSNFSTALTLGLPKCPIPVFFRYDLQEVLLKMRSKCYMSNGNMQTNRAIVKPVAQMISKFNFKDIYSTIRNTSDDDYRTYINYSQQEFLIKEEFNFSSLKSFNIIVKSEIDKQELINRIGVNNKLVNKIFTDDFSSNLFHNENKQIYCNYEDNVLDISSEYKGDGINSGVFKIEFEEHTQYEIISGNIIDATNTTITAYPKINIRFLNNTKCKVYFRDLIKKIDWELYNWN
jgi:hypothetical protein